MFRNRSFRAKLALAIAPPLVVLIALVGTVVRPRLQEAADAKHKQEQASLATANMQLRDELQIERDATIQKIASRPGLAVKLGDVRTQTNQRRVALRDAIKAFRPEDATERAAVAVAQQSLADLETLRSDIDTNALGPFQVYEGFENLVELQLAVNQSVARGSTDTDLLRQASANVSYMQFKNAIARTNSYIGLRVESGSLTQTDLLKVSADLALADEYRAQFMLTATPTAVAAEQARVATPEYQAAIATRDDVLLAGSRNRTPDIAPSAWWDQTRGQLAAMDVVEDQVFEDFVGIAGVKETEARQDSTLYLSALGIAVLLAALTALALGRSISGRLAKVSDEAHEIASERLPEVLDALRNPTPEVLANALPQVKSDSNDEIGSLAESFNTVLRTAVETSIAHSQRRADTLTNILVNLGRRNQSLIDRQLELVDELESTQRDPEVLRGLFQLDHMITSLRRNAENLLVLASDSQARSWSEAVPVVDVVRGAVAEVEDMSRIALELDLGEESMLSGRYAVDLSHLIAELVDNALAFSPPTSTVHLRSDRTSQHYRVWILDNGLGMNELDLAAANLRVSNPPDVDELSADRIGFQVVGRLARRLGVSVRLQANPGGGLAASVTIPVALIEAEEVVDNGFVVPPPAAATRTVAPTAIAAGATAPPTAFAEASARAAGPEPAFAARAAVTPPGRIPGLAPPAIAASANGATSNGATSNGATSNGATPNMRPEPIVAAAVAEPMAATATPEPTVADTTPEPTVATVAPGSVALPRRTSSWFDLDGDPAPLEVPAPSSTTTGGLQRRVPGQAFVGEEKAQQFDSGQFRRLPMPGDRKGAADDLTLAERRLNALSGLQSGAGRARIEDLDDEL